MFQIKTIQYKKLQFLVTGTGRCGTVFFAHLLTSIGIPCGHEHIFNFESKKKCFDRLVYPEKRINSFVSEHSLIDEKYHNEFVDPKKTVAESSYFLVPYLNENYLKNIPLIHVVRNPLKVIRSFVDDFDYFKDIEDKKIEIFENFMYLNYPEIKNFKNPYDRAGQYYISCNEKIFKQKKERPYLLVKIEEVIESKNLIQKFFKKLFPENLPNHLNKKSNENTKEIDFSFFENNEIKEKIKNIMENLKYSI